MSTEGKRGQIALNVNGDHRQALRDRLLGDHLAQHGLARAARTHHKRVPTQALQWQHAREAFAGRADIHRPATNHRSDHTGLLANCEAMYL